jgi:hypothetical protein
MPNMLWVGTLTTDSEVSSHASKHALDRPGGFWSYRTGAEPYKTLYPR